MKLYLAPLEGITSYIYRKALYQCFDGFDKYFIPFIRAKQNLNFSGREKKDISPENNSGMYAVPQILTRNADDFLRTANQLKEYGYQEVNLNLGCPSKTVVTKGCGAGFLARPEELEQFLDRIFSKTDMKISVKTRLGMENAEEFPRLMEIYNHFPMEELIIHPRVQKDFYKNTPNLEAFGEALAISKNPVCYNGDIFSADDFKRIQSQFPDVECFMMGRGVLAAVTGFEREIDFFRFYNFPENLTGNVRREILLYKFLEGFRGINFSGYFISDSVSTLQTVLDQSQNFDRPVDKGDTAVGHAFLKLVDQLFCQDI